MDDSLQSFTKLQALVLAGNCLSEVPGHYLPRELLLLELCCNRLQDVSHLLEHCPPYLLYLGLARNYLTQGTVTDTSSDERLNCRAKVRTSLNQFTHENRLISCCFRSGRKSDVTFINVIIIDYFATRRAVSTFSQAIA